MWWLCRTNRSIELLALSLVIYSLSLTVFLSTSTPSSSTEPLPFFGHPKSVVVIGSSSSSSRSHNNEKKNDRNTTKYNLKNSTIDTTTNESSERHVAILSSATSPPPPQDQQRQETHKIPRILLFTHYRNLLDESEHLVDEEEIVLAKNVRHSMERNHPHTTIFLTDTDCIASLHRVFPNLVPFFQNETQGMFKADICRGSALYEHGGIYLDVDIGVRKDLWLDLLPTTEFVTSKVHQQSNYLNHFFQAILGAAPQSPILYKYLQLFYDHYTGVDVVEKGPLGVILLRRAWDRVYNNVTGPSTELYSEVLYDKKLFPNLHPAPTWGTRRACHFVVVAKANDPNHTEITYRDHHFHVPLYSRIAGSRMCPYNTNNDNNNNNDNSKEKKGEK